MINAGKLDHLIQLSQKTITQSGIGEETAVWSTLADVWAMKSYRIGREFYQAGRIVSEDRVYFTIRHLNGLEPSMKIVEGADTYDLLFVKYSTKRRESIELECKRLGTNAFTYYIDITLGDDTFSGTSQWSAWATTDKADIQELAPGETIGYNLGGRWVLYRTLDMTADLAELPSDVVTAPADSF